MQSFNTNNILVSVNVFCLLVVIFLFGESRWLQEPRLSAVESTITGHATRLNELELRQTNALQYLETRLNNVSSKLDDSNNKAAHRLQIIEARQGTHQR